MTSELRGNQSLLYFQETLNCCGPYFQTKHVLSLIFGVYYFILFPIKNGLKQGDAVSQLLFNFPLEYVITKVQANQVIARHTHRQYHTAIRPRCSTGSVVQSQCPCSPKDRAAAAMAVLRDQYKHSRIKKELIYHHEVKLC